MNQSLILRKGMEADLRNAIANDELVLHLQPQVSFEKDAIIGVEALLRWQHPDEGLIAPDLFIPLAEETGLIIKVGEWVIREACRQVKVP